MAGAIIQTDVYIKPQGLGKWCNNFLLKVLNFENPRLTLDLE